METPPSGNLHQAVTWWDDFPATRERGLLWSRPVGLAIGLLGVILLTIPLVLADRFVATLVSPNLIFMPLIAATAYGWLLFSDVPGFTTIAGAGLIAASGLYTAWREHRHRRRLRQAAAAVPAV